MTSIAPTRIISLAARDHAILRGIALHRPMAPRGYYTLLHSKLAHAEVHDTIPSDAAAINSLVRYRVGAGSTLEHRLVVGNFSPLGGSSVSIRTVIGLALIGEHSGASIELPGSDGSLLVVEAVSHPEAESVR